jgi:Tfp pilus assembly protein PilN
VGAILGALPIILIIAGIILMGLHYMNLKKQEKSLREQITQIDTDIAEMQSQVSQQQQAADLASQLAAKQAAVQSLALNQRYAVYVMEYLCRALYPEQTALAEEADKGIYLTAMALSDSTMHITGIARTWGDIVSFQRRLAELKPDGQNTLFQLADFGQTYSLTLITPTGATPAGAGAGTTGAETRYQFDLEVSVNRASLAPLVGDYSGI